MPTFEITTPDGRVFDITGETQEGALAALKDHLGDNGQEQSAPKTEVDTSMGGAMQYGYDNAGKLIGKGIQGFGELAGSDTMQTYGKTMAERNEQEIAQSNYQRPDGADGIVKNLREGDLINAGKSLAYGAAEAAPQMAGGIVASSAAMVSSPVIAGGLLVGGTAYGITSAMGENKSEKEEKGLDADATASDLAAAVASGVLEILPVKGGGATLKILKEGAQEAGQEGLVIGNTAIQGGAYVPDEILNRMGDAGIIGSTLAGATNTAITTVNKAGEVVFKPREELAPEVGQAAGDVARMLRETADGSGFNLKDINPSSLKGADETMNAVRRTIHSEVKSAADQIRKQVVKDLDPETLEKFNNIVKASNQKVGSGVTVQEIQLVKDLAGSTEFGQKMVNGLYKSNALTEVYASGLKGGVSQFTDAFNPFQNVGRSYGIGGSTIAGAFSGSSAFYSGGATLGLAAGGRAIDAVTGRRSKVNRFVQKNAKKSGLATPTGTALPLNKAQQAKKAKDAQTAANNAKREAAKAERRKEQAEQNVVKYSEGYAPNYGDPRVNQKADPRGTVHNSLVQSGSLEGMSVKEIDAEIQRVIDAKLKDVNTPKLVKKALKNYDGFNKLGAMPKGDNTLHLAIAAIREGFTYSTIVPTNPTPTNATPAPPQRSPEVQQGIDDNRKFVQNLIDKLDESYGITDKDRLILKNSLGEYQLSLGKDPRTASQAIIDRARKNLSNENLADKYLMPYHTRVVSQQAAVNTGVTNPNEPTGTTGSPPTAVSPTPPVLEPKPNVPPAPTTTTGGVTQEPKVGNGGGQGGVLGTPEPVTPPVEVPKVKAVKKELPRAKALIEIGKKGSKYENGIQDWEQALEVASILGQIVHTYSSNAAMAKGKKAQGHTGTTSLGTRGMFSQYDQQKGAGGTIWTIRPFGTVMGEKRSKVGATTTLIHEIAHGVTIGNISGEGTNVYTPDKHAKNHVTGQKNRYKSGSFVESAIVPLLSNAQLSKDSPIVKEINNLQFNIKVYDKKNPSESRDVRDFARMARDNYSESSIQKHRKYTMNFHEATVDPVWVYMYDPKLAHEVMPETAKLIQEEFRKAGNKQIQFYSNPFAMILATVLAMAGMSIGEDEEPPEGILSPQGGVLAL